MGPTRGRAAEFDPSPHKAGVQPRFVTSCCHPFTFPLLQRGTRSATIQGGAGVVSAGAILVVYGAGIDGPLGSRWHRRGKMMEGITVSEFPLP